MNAADSLPEQLLALSAQTYAKPWEVIVADNGSTDGTLALVAAWERNLPGLRVADASARRGASAARNAGARQARGDLLLFCDADDVVAPGWLGGMVASARRYDIVGGRLDREALNDPVTRSWRSNLQAECLPVGLRFLPYAMSANMGVWAPVFHELGGWREEFPGAAGEDVEFSWRAQLASYRLGFAPDGVVRYRYRPGVRALIRQAYGYGVADAHLYRVFRTSGIPATNIFRALASWARLVADLPAALRSKQERGRWVRRLAFRVGRIRGSVRHRVVCP